jgi:hypothetical protein
MSHVMIRVSNIHITYVETTTYVYIALVKES